MPAAKIHPYLVSFARIGLMFEHAWTQRADPAALLGVVYYAVVPTVGGYLLWYAGAARVSAGVASLYTAVLPVSALALAAVVLRESIGPGQLLGAGCVLAAIAVTAAKGPAR